MKKGRRGKFPPQLTKARALIRPSLEAGENVIPKELERQYGISADSFERALHAELARMEALEQAGVAMWTKSAIKKLAGSIRAHRKRLELEFEGRVLCEVRKRIENTVLPSLREREAIAMKIVQSHKGIMSREDYRKILACLHPDRVDQELKERYEAAFHIFKSLEKVLVKTEPVGPVVPPRFSDLVLRRRQYSAKRAVRVR